MWNVMFREESYCTSRSARARNVSSGVWLYFVRLIFQKKRGWDDRMNGCPQGGGFGSCNIKIAESALCRNDQILLKFPGDGAAHSGSRCSTLRLTVQYTQCSTLRLNYFLDLVHPVIFATEDSISGNETPTEMDRGLSTISTINIQTIILLPVNSVISLSQILIPAAHTHTHTNTNTHTHTQHPVQ